MTKEQKQKLSDLFIKSLNRVKLSNYTTDDGDPLPLVDFLSFGDTILEGQMEIENIVEQIVFDMDEKIEIYLNQLINDEIERRISESDIPGKQTIKSKLIK